MKTKLLLTLMICGFAMGLASVVLASGGNYNAVGKAQVTAKTEKVACANARDEAVKDAVRVCAKSHLLPQMDQFFRVQL